MKAIQPFCEAQASRNILLSTSRRQNRLYSKGLRRPFSSITAQDSSGSQEQASAPSQEQVQSPEDKLLKELAREDQEAAELINGKSPIFDLFPPPPPRLNARQQKERAFKLSRRPLRPHQDLQRAHASRRQRGADKASATAAPLPVELMPADLRPSPPLPPVCNLPRSSAADKEAAQKRVSNMLEHYKPREGGEGIGSYASKVAAAGLGPLPNPRLVAEYHPMVSKARMDRSVAAGYDPNAEWGSESILAGQDMTDLGDDDEKDEELHFQGAAEDRPSSSAAANEAKDGDFPELNFEESDEVDWGADFEDEEEETLHDEFGRALDETIEQRLGEDASTEDSEGFDVWDGINEEDGGQMKDRGLSNEQEIGSEDVEDLDSAILKWQKLTKMRKAEGP